MRYERTRMRHNDAGRGRALGAVRAPVCVLGRDL